MTNVVFNWNKKNDRKGLREQCYLLSEIGNWVLAHFESPARTAPVNKMTARGRRPFRSACAGGSASPKTLTSSPVTGGGPPSPILAKNCRRKARAHRHPDTSLLDIPSRPFFASTRFHQKNRGQRTCRVRKLEEKHSGGIGCATWPKFIHFRNARPGKRNAKLKTYPIPKKAIKRIREAGKMSKTIELNRNEGKLN